MSEQMDKPKESIDKEVIYYDQRSVALRTKQSFYFVKEHDKIGMIDLLLNDYKSMPVVIVVRSKKQANSLGVFLRSKELKAMAVHGNHREAQQQEATKNFNENTLDIIITTDMILKTLALENIKLVLSFNLPDMTQEYYNRLALMKELGVGVAFVSPEDEPFLGDIEYNMKKEIEEKTLEGFVSTPLPTPLEKSSKDRRKKPRHSKKKSKKEL